MEAIIYALTAAELLALTLASHSETVVIAESSCLAFVVLSGSALLHKRVDI